MYVHACFPACVCLCVSSCYKDGEAKLPYIRQTQLPSLSELIAGIHFAVSLFKDFLMWPMSFLKSLLNLLCIASVLCFGFVAEKSMWDVAPDQGIKPIPRHWKAEVIITELLGEGSAASLTVSWGHGLSYDS